MKYELMKHQQLAIETCNHREYFAYFMDPGLGKTLTVIDETRHIGVKKVVVICPKSIMGVWAEEIDNFAPNDTVMLWNGDEYSWNQVDGNITWYIINIDAINTITVKLKDEDGKPIIIGYKKGKPVYSTKTYSKGLDRTLELIHDDDHNTTMVVVDESTTIKNITSNRTQSVMGLKKLAKYRRILTGTPMANSPLDVYAQMKFLSDTIFPNNYFAFRARYATMGGFQCRQVMGYKNLDRMSAIIDQHSFRATKAEWLKELPPRTTQIRSVELTATTWKAYRALVDEVAVEIGENPMAIDMAIKKMVKLRQLTGGWIIDDDKVAHQIGKEKFEELKQLLDECRGQKVIVWCQFTHEVLEIQKLHPMTRVYHGAMNSKARDEARNAFEHGDCPMIVIQNDTGSMGLTLNAATVSIFYSNAIYPLPKEQARDRNYRKGQTQPVTEYELIVKGSIDETIYNSIINGRSLSEAIMSAKGDPETIKQAMMPRLRRVDWRAPTKGRG